MCPTIRPHPRFIPVNFRQIGIEHDLYSADGVYSRFEQVLIYQEKSGFFGATASAALTATSFFIVNSSGVQAGKNAKDYTLVQYNIDLKIQFVSRFVWDFLKRKTPLEASPKSLICCCSKSLCALKKCIFKAICPTNTVKTSLFRKAPETYSKTSLDGVLYSPIIRKFLAIAEHFVEPFTERFYRSGIRGAVKMKYYLPLKENSQKVEIETETNSVILIGANGSGKSYLGAWIERQNLEKVHRIGGQRNLNFNENISLKSYSNAMNAVFYGNENYTTNKAGYRWNNNHLTTTLLNDFESVLSAMISKHNDESREYVDLCSEAEKNGTAKPVVPKRIFDRLKDVWDSIFTQRTLKIKDSKFYASFGVNEYSATNMSDGERAVLYLASQVLCVPSNKILIIDEPELHLHRSIMYHLWSELEKARPDCLFIYITHDLDFVSSHIVSDIYWVKSYDGNNNWQIEKIVSDNVPADLQAEILGSRKPILFVEGEKNSFDTQLYSAVYPNYHVIGCGGCSQVIMRTKAFNATRLSDMPN